MMRDDLRRLIEILNESGSDYFDEVECIADKHGFAFSDDGHLYDKETGE